MAKGASCSPTPRRRCSSARCTTSWTGPVAMAVCSSPTKPTRITGAAISSAVYSATRRPKLRGCSTCQRKFETVLDFLDGADEGPGQQYQAHGAHDAAGDAAGELQHAHRELLRGTAAERPEELEHERLQIAPAAEDLEHRETEGEQRNQRQQRGVHQAHRPQVDLPAGQIPQHRVGVAQQAQAGAEQPRALRQRPEEAPVQQGPDAHPHGLRIQCRLRGCGAS